MKPDVIQAAAVVIVPVATMLWFLIRMEVRSTVQQLGITMERRLGQVEQRIARLEGPSPSTPPLTVRAAMGAFGERRRHPPGA